MDRKGFTIVETVIAIVVLSAGILGLATSTSYMVRVASNAGAKAEALQVVDGRISQMVMDPRYHHLASVYGGTETEIPGLEGMTMSTRIVHSKRTWNGRVTDYKTVTVTIEGPGLSKPISRTVILGAP